MAFYFYDHIKRIDAGICYLLYAVSFHFDINFKVIHVYNLLTMPF
jgi:hypothetical protein